MGKNKYHKFFCFICSLGLLVGFYFPPLVYGQASSNNYKVEEVYFGPGGELNANSTNYGAQQSAGGVNGNASSNNYDANGGPLTSNTPFLEAAVMDADVNFGNMSDSAYSYGAAQGGTCNCSFYVRTYNSSSYVVVTASQPPTNESGDSLDAKGTLGVPSNDNSVEEFGINLVDNSTPDMGANLSNQPDNSFADGKIATGYDTPDQFKYGVGDIIAQSQATAGNPAIGLTNYTISYIAKPSSITPAGQYTMDQVLIVTPTY